MNLNMRVPKCGFSRKPSYLIVALLVCSLGVFQLRAQDTNLDDTLFGGESSDITTVPPSKAEEVNNLANPGEPIPASVKLGGNLFMTASLAQNPANWDMGFNWYNDTTATLKLGTKLYVDARPSDSLRFFVKGEADYPFVNAANYSLRELFADLTIDNTVFLRLGKQTINWGVGYWFSPANIINLGNKDPEDPTAELVGPVAIKLQVPVGNNNYYLYAILQDMETKKTAGIAGKGEWVIGDTELSLGGLYRPDQPWAATATVSTKLWQFDVYGEGLLKGQDDRHFVLIDSSEPLGIAITTHKNQLEGAATVGFTWIWSDDSANINLSLGGQYYWNGSGYADQSIFNTYAAGIGAAIANGSLSAADLYQRGQHYAAVNVGLSDFFKTDLGLGVQWLANLQDGSGKLINTLSYSGIDKLRLSLIYTFNYGDKGSEFSPLGHGSSLGLSLDLVDVSF